ncbi:MAG TPA: hypothetical protein ENN13_03440 [Candidatus Altiarchaeales archaeon]|nr:hypothetical protein [Candidatus Altiarchaeales archaeon]
MGSVTSRFFRKNGNSLVNEVHSEGLDEPKSFNPDSSGIFGRLARNHLNRGLHYGDFSFGRDLFLLNSGLATLLLHECSGLRPNVAKADLDSSRLLEIAVSKYDPDAEASSSQAAWMLGNRKYFLGLDKMLERIPVLSDNTALSAFLVAVGQMGGEGRGLEIVEKISGYLNSKTTVVANAAAIGVLSSYPSCERELGFGGDSERKSVYHKVNSDSVREKVLEGYDGAKEPADVDKRMVFLGLIGGVFGEGAVSKVLSNLSSHDARMRSFATIMAGYIAKRIEGGDPGKDVLCGEVGSDANLKLISKEFERIRGSVPPSLNHRDYALARNLIILCAAAGVGGFDHAVKGILARFNRETVYDSSEGVERFPPLIMNAEVRAALEKRR